MADTRKKNLIIAGILVALALMFFLLSDTLSDPENFKGTVASLTEKEMTVAKMSAVSIAAASAIDLIPGDTGNSISNQLVNLGGFFVLLFAALYLEKLLIGIGGAVAFKALIPIGLILIAGFFVFRREGFKALGSKLITIGLVIFLISPASVWVSQALDKTHDQSRQQAIEEISEDTELVEKEKAAETEKGENKNKITQIFGSTKNELSTAAGKIKELPEKASQLLNNLIEEVAYFVVSICVIPVVVLVILVVVIKQVLGFGAGGAMSSANYSALLRAVRSGRREEEA